jgi:hypothetical protein
LGMQMSFMTPGLDILPRPHSVKFHFDCGYVGNIYTLTASSATVAYCVLLKELNVYYLFVEMKTSEGTSKGVNTFWYSSCQSS